MRSRVALGLVLMLTLLPRIAELRVMSERNMSPDSAHFLNVARCFERGQGFSNPSAWPAWMKPDRLPMPETFKEPGYSWLIARAAQAGADPFRAAQAMSLIAGLLLPFVIWLLARQLDPDPLVPLLAALIAAGSPLLVDKSASVLVESLFALTTSLMFLAAAWRVRDADRTTRPLALEALVGLLFGAAYLLRAQTLLTLPALAALLMPGRNWPRRLVGAALSAVAALAVMSPLLLRNLRLFGVPFYSDVPAFGVLPYVDLITIHHGLERPPAVIPFALTHSRQVLIHVLWSLRHFLPSALPRELYGNPLWLIGLVAAPWALRGRWRAWWFPVLYAGLTTAFILAVHWDTYYFTSSMAAWCLLAAAGLVWLARRLDARRGTRRAIA
ncbi:MAG: glycosyltransferase family 39 protein, partial [Candidatus Eiseniibacteriota bacterium]